jgi:hypothetical protein
MNIKKAALQRQTFSYYAENDAAFLQRQMPTKSSQQLDPKKTKSATKQDD